MRVENHRLHRLHRTGRKTRLGSRNACGRYETNDSQAANGPGVHELHGLSDRVDAWTGLLDGSGRRCSVREFLSHSSLGLTSIDGRIQSRHVRTVSDRDGSKSRLARPQARPRHAHHGTVVLPRASRAHPAVRRYAGSHQTTPGRRSTVIRAKVAGEARSGRGGDCGQAEEADKPYIEVIHGW